EESLHKYLIHQQRLVGIAPENVIPMHRCEPTVAGPRLPPLLRLSNEGLAAPLLPPVTFNGVIQPFPSQPGDPTGMGPNYHHTANSERSQTSSSSSGCTGLLDGISLNGDQNLVHPAGINPNLLGNPVPRYGDVQGNAFRPAGPVSSNINRAHMYSPLALQQQQPTPVPPLLPGVFPRIPYIQLPPRGTSRRARRRRHAATRPHAGFDILHAILLSKGDAAQDLAYKFTAFLEAPDLGHLWQLSKYWKMFINKQLPRIIRFRVEARHANAAKIFPWRCYSSLYFSRLAHPTDSIPASSQLPPPPHPGPTPFLVAHTASFRWIAMLTHRTTIVNDIMALLAQANCPLPLACKPAIMKVWFLMNIPDMPRRTWTIQNRNLWTDLDILLAIYFVVRIDQFVRLKRGNQTAALRHLIMAQSSLEFLFNVLRGDALRSGLDTLRTYLRWQYPAHPAPRHLHPDDELLGIPPHEVGALQFEGYGRGPPGGPGYNPYGRYGHPHEGRAPARLRRPDEMLLLEARRRELNLERIYRDVFLFGRTDAHTRCDRPGALWDIEIARTIRAEGL
ncbi:hypothetical protein P175DRAFT_0418764, partial [Aspergillus ochraceoroseus IBT 24754]